MESNGDMANMETVANILPESERVDEIQPTTVSARDVDGVESASKVTLPAGVKYQVLDASEPSSIVNITALMAEADQADEINCYYLGTITSYLDQVRDFAKYFCQINDGVQVAKVTAEAHLNILP